MRIIFAGTPEFALPSLDALAASGHKLLGVLTQPDRPAGRGRRLAPSPVKRRAGSLGLPVWQPETLKNRALQDELAALRPDVMVVVAYGLLLPRAVLALPVHGCVNVHASLLPRWRGAAPIARAILAGDQETGVTIMRMNAGLDTGDILLQRDCPIDAEATAGDLHDRLAEQGATLLLEALNGLAAGRIAPVPQDDAEACYAPRLDKAEAAVDWTRPAEYLARAVRAFNPWPVAHADLDGQRVRIWRARVASGTVDAAPGTIVAAGGDGMDVATGRGQLRILELQWPGGRRIAAADAVHGRDLVGRRFGGGDGA
ncbi:methionyl-tRNA formyltransferase [Salinisphaera sp. PC39]|uniref:methionyl-tRNA formyltransferase n=1 Tax=Salinisphaera sp. PC39 TaxID=1304156 RepID=UPI00333F47D7